MLKIKKYNQKYIKEWDRFVSISNNGTMFHNKFFLSYHIDKKFIDCSLMVYFNSKLVALFSAVAQNNLRKNKGHSVQLNWILPPSMTARTRVPSRTFPASKARPSSVSSSFWIALFRGRAP